MIAALWFGIAFCLLLIATPSAFSASPNSTVAANVVGAMLTRWHYIAILAPLVLLFLQMEDRRPRLSGQPRRLSSILLVAIILAAAEAVIDLRIREIRRESAVPMSSRPLTDPVRRRFGLLHGVSSLLLLGQGVAAGIVVGRSDG